MKQYMLDCRDIDSRDSLHDVLAQTLSLPAWYGRNLDALHDCLTDLPEETELTLLCPDALEAALGDYALAFRGMLIDVALESPRFSLSLRSGSEEA